MDEQVVKVLLDTKENLEATIESFNDFGVAALTNIGREFNSDNHLINIGGNGSVTKTYDIVNEDSEAGFYITHPEYFRGRWSDEYVDGLINLILPSSIVDTEFNRTIDEGLI